MKTKAAVLWQVCTMCFLGTFSPYAVMSERSLVKIPQHVPLEIATLVSCGVTTGYGSAVHTARVQPSETVVVGGVGGVGANAVQGARVTSRCRLDEINSGYRICTMAATSAASSRTSTESPHLPRLAAALIRRTAWQRSSSRRCDSRTSDRSAR